MYVYLIRSNENGFYKIGYSKNPEKRIKQLQTGGCDLTLLHKYKSKNSKKIEGILHRRYTHLRIFNEWFDLDLFFYNEFLNICNKIDNNLIKLKEFGNNFI